MSQFADELQGVLAKKAEQLHVEELIRDRQRREAQRQADETASAAAALVRDVFRPLLEEFFLVLEAAGVLCGGVVEEDRDGAGAYLCRLRARGTAPSAPRYEIRVACAIIESGRIEAAIECFDATTAELGEETSEDASTWTALFEPRPAAVSPPGHPRSGSAASSAPGGDPSSLIVHPSSLLTLPKKTFRAAGLAVGFDKDSAREWCAGLLKKCGRALMEANGQGS
jgi:hypothetical protein